MEAKTILTPETLTLFLYFVVPGFVALQFYDALVPGDRRNFGESTIQLIAYSLFDYVILSGALLYVAKAGTPWYVAIPVRLVYFVVAPFAIVLALYYLRVLRPKWWRLVLKRLHVQMPNPIPTAWDEFFLEERACYILFHLKSKEVVGGAFGKSSAATLSPGSQQIYVERIWVVDSETKEFIQEESRTMGGIIKIEDCDYIEMFTVDDVMPGSVAPQGGENENKAKAVAPTSSKEGIDD